MCRIMGKKIWNGRLKVHLWQCSGTSGRYRLSSCLGVLWLSQRLPLNPDCLVKFCYIYGSVILSRLRAAAGLNSWPPFPREHSAHCTIGCTARCATLTQLNPDSFHSVFVISQVHWPFSSSLEHHKYHRKCDLLWDHTKLISAAYIPDPAHRCKAS